MKLHNFCYLLKEGFRNLKGNRTMTIASIAVLVSCLLLTGAAMMFSMNINMAMELVEGNNSVTVYLNEEIPTLEPSRLVRNCVRWIMWSPVSLSPRMKRWKV